MTDRPDYEIAAEELAALIKREGLAIKASFIPFSQSDNAEQNGSLASFKSLNWKVSILHRHLFVCQTSYSQGIGHAPAMKDSGICCASLARQLALREIETGSRWWVHPVSRRLYETLEKIEKPSAVDVIGSLCGDSAVLDYPDFQSWAEDFGYNADSIRDRGIYDACLDTAHPMRDALGSNVLEEMRELASRL